MAISKELKAYINRKYEARITEVKARKAEALNRARTAHLLRHKGQAIALAEETVQDLVDQMELLKSDGYSITYNGKDFIKAGILSLVTLPQFEEVAKESKVYDRQIELIDHEREKLLITISLEKNYDAINELLKQYDISL